MPEQYQVLQVQANSNPNLENLMGYWTQHTANIGDSPALTREIPVFGPL